MTNINKTLYEKAYRNLMNLDDSGEGNEKESFIYKISSKNLIIENYFGDKSVREFPHCESKQIYNFFKDEDLIEKYINLTEYNKTNLGEHIINFGTNGFDNFNQIKISAPKSLLNAFLAQKDTDRKFNIMFNSIRYIPKTQNLCKINLNTLDMSLKEVKDYITKYGTPLTEEIKKNVVNDPILDAISEIDTDPEKISLNEDPITQQYCNFYEYLDMKNKEDYYNKFVVIITNENLYNAYRELYPHFIIATQPNVSFPCAGLTRYTALALSTHANLNRVIFSDDNVININIAGFNYVTQSPSMYASYRLQNVKILEDLFLKDTLELIQLNDEFNKKCEKNKTRGDRQSINLNDYGYLGSSNGFGGFNHKASWVQNSFNQDYFHDYTVSDIRVDSSHIKEASVPITNDNIYIRDFINKKRHISEIPTSDTADLSFINPHRLKFIIVNVQVIKEKKISYNPLHTMAEDIYFTREIFQKNLKTCQLSIGITLPKDNRRPITCRSDACPDEDCYNLIEPKNIESLKKIYPHRADLITYLGGLLFFNKTGVLAYGGAFGPAKLLTVDDTLKYNLSVTDKINKDNDILDANKGTCINKFSTKLANYKINDEIVDNINYIEPNKYKNIIYENNDFNYTQQKRMENVLNYFTNKMSNITNTKTRQEYIKNFLKTYVMWYDIISISSFKNISKSTGMFKYVKEYEFENILSFQNFSEFYDKNKTKVSEVYKRINDVLTRLNIKDICNRKNDILFYIENYSIYPEEIFKLLCLYIIYTKMYKFIDSNSKDNLFQISEEKDINRMLLLFGNINDTIYINNNIRTEIQEYMNLFILKINNKKINLNTEELKTRVDEIYNRLSLNY